jgi:hypothetical protein
MTGKMKISLVIAGTLAVGVIGAGLFMPHRPLGRHRIGRLVGA